jgi:hypothetical protein
MRCIYSYAARIGKPKGSKNKKTLERLRQISVDNSTNTETSNSSSKNSKISGNNINGNNKRPATETASGEYDAGGAEAETGEGAGENEVNYTDHMEYEEESSDGHVEGTERSQSEISLGAFVVSRYMPP